MLGGERAREKSVARFPLTLGICDADVEDDDDGGDGSGAARPAAINAACNSASSFASSSSPAAAPAAAPAGVRVVDEDWRGRRRERAVVDEMDVQCTNKLLLAFFGWALPSTL